MQLTREPVPSRRALLKTGGLFAGAMMIPSAVSAGLRREPESLLPAGVYEGHSAGGFTADSFPVGSANSLGTVRPTLMRRALAALQHHGSAIQRHDRIAIADFATSSGTPRFHLINLEDGRTRSKLVAHGSGSDPAHTGYLQRFSNANGSNASCEGAFLTSDYYVGKHGKSQRLVGLDHTNNNALDLAEQDRPDLVVCDVKLADGDSGITAATALADRGVPCIFLSGNCPADGGHPLIIGCVAKPFHTGSLGAAVQAAYAIARGETPEQVPAALRLYRELPA